MSQSPPEHPDSNSLSGLPLNGREEQSPIDHGEVMHASGGSSEGNTHDTVDGIPLAEMLSDSGDASTLFQMDDRVLVTVDESGNRLDSYADARELAKWRYGRLLEATHPKLHRRVQLLVLDSPHSAKPSVRDLFLERVRGVASLHSPFIDVGISEAVIDEDKLFLVLEPTTLRALDMFRPRSTEEQHADWFFPNQLLAQRLLELAQGVDAIHRKEMVHGAIDEACLRLNEQTNVATLVGLIKTDTIVESQAEYNAPILDRRAADLRRLAHSFANLTSVDGSDGSTDGDDLAASLGKRNRELSPALIRLLARFADSGGRGSVLSASELVQHAQALARRQVKMASWFARLWTLSFELLFVGLLFVAAGLTAATFFRGDEADRGFALISGFAPAYLVLSELLTGTTLARRSRGLYLLDRTGTKPGFFQLLARLLLRWGIIAAPAMLVGFGSHWLAIDNGVLGLVIGSIIGLVTLYSTSVFLPGHRPLHDHITGITYGIVETLPLSLSFGDQANVEAVGARQAVDITPYRIDAAAQPLGPVHLRDTIDQYELKREVGRGGMGTVYQARDITLNRTVAVKSISPHLASGREAVRRFEQEARIAAQLSHRNVAKVFGVGSAAGQPYLVMEYVSGETLQQLVESRGALPVDVAWSYVLQAAHGMREAGRLGIVHRDIKPSNLMLDKSGMIKVMDFGLSKFVSGSSDPPGDSIQTRQRLPEESATVLDVQQESDIDDVGAGELTKAGSIVGSPMYMSPEQSSAGDVDCRSDIYSLGLTLYSLLVGKPPFATTSGAASLIARQQTETLPTLLGKVTDFTSEQDAVLQQMIAKQPDQRHDGYDSLIADLEATAPSKPEPATALRRMSAVILNLIFVAILELPLALSTGFSLKLLTIEAAVGILPAVIIYVIGIGYFGCTPGKWLLGLRVVDPNGSPIGWRRALLRCTVCAPMWPILLATPLLAEAELFFVLALIGCVPAFVSWILITTGRGQTLHDVAANSRVVRIRRAGRRNRPGAT